jgi:subtilisin family serine protease
MARITINGITVDPQQQAVGLAAANLVQPTAQASNFILVQTQADKSLTADQRQTLKDAGAEILEYVPENTYICHYSPSDLGPIRALPFVAWTNVYMREFKVSPRLRSAAAPPGVASLLALPPMNGLSKEHVRVDIVLQQGVPMTQVADEIAKVAGLDPATLKPSPNKVRATVERRRLQAISEIDGVRHIEPFTSPRVFNDVARDVMGADAVQAGGNMRGDGQIVAVCDTGFDRGVINQAHPAFAGRVHRLYALGRPTASDPNGHGTHVCGSVLGDGVMNDGTQVRGTAPEARLVMQSVLDPDGGLGGLPSDLRDLFITPYRDDAARIHTNSWGSDERGAYTTSSSEVDDFVWNHRDCVICFAAGNAGIDSQGVGRIDPGSVGSPATAKNCITVGASENRRPDFSFPGSNQPAKWGDGWPASYPANPIHEDVLANNADGMAAFSSRGPAAHNRVRPDVVAPGTAILSTRSRVATGPGWGPSVDPDYFFEGGTSMATPLVAGAAAVVRQFLQSRGLPTPSAALIKAMLINGARIMPGQYHPPEAASPPDFAQGFGRVDLDATIGLGSVGGLMVRDEEQALDTGQSESLPQPVNVAGQTLKVTLVWTDPPGEALQNDLDLVVITAGGQEFHGNMPVGSTAFDRDNNVEQVIAPNLQVGDATIEVRGFRITRPQSYALVVRLI